MIEIKNFTKQYGDFAAVKNISLSVPAGSVAALVGPNGAGKTTTIRTLCGLLRPTIGQLEVAGIQLDRDPVGVKRAAAYVPDDPPLFDSLTVYEHLMFIAQSFQLVDWEPEANRLLEEFQLTDKKDSSTTELSRGMRQKVAIACAYLRDPKVLLLDEPMTGLDPASIRKLKQTVRARADRGATVLISSHLLSLVEDICDHVIMMKAGSVLFSGSLSLAREQLGSPGQTLEEIFFQVTGDVSEASI